MSFTEQQQNWEALAKTDPMWAVLSEPAKRGNKWDRAEFYVTGREELAEAYLTFERLDLPVGLPGSDERALDLGCGPGRITHELSRDFEEVVGYDISPQMLGLARQAANENETYVLNESDDLSPFEDGSFDFVYCSKVLQHIDPEKVGTYMAEMVRVAKPGGVIFCQMLSHPTGWEGTRESSPDPAWGEKDGPPPHYSVLYVSIDGMMHAWMELDVIIHQARLVEKGEGQTYFSYDYIVQRRS